MAGKSTQTLAERFWPKVRKTDGCWLWIGAKANGYGRVAFNGKVAGAHRVSYEMAHGPIPVGLQLDHLCRTRACVRPDHLEAVTCRENLLRGTGLVAVEVAKTHCPQGHPYSGDNLLYSRTKRGGLCRVCRTCRDVRNRRRAA